MSKEGRSHTRLSPSTRCVPLTDRYINTEYTVTHNSEHVFIWIEDILLETVCGPVAMLVLHRGGYWYIDSLRSFNRNIWPIKTKYIGSFSCRVMITVQLVLKQSSPVVVWPLRIVSKLFHERCLVNTWSRQVTRSQFMFLVRPNFERAILRRQYGLRPGPWYTASYKASI